jgi:hypothetical protein
MAETILILQFLGSQPLCWLYIQYILCADVVVLLARYIQGPWGWHSSVETCRSVITCQFIVHLLFNYTKVFSCSPVSWLYIQSVMSMLLCWSGKTSFLGWLNIIETCMSVIIICKFIVHFLVYYTIFFSMQSCKMAVYKYTVCMLVLLLCWPGVCCVTILV